MKDDPSTLLAGIPDDLMSSPRIRAALESSIIDLIDEVFGYVHDALEVGDSATRIAIVKSIMPMLLKVSKDTEGADIEDIETMREETRNLITASGRTLGLVPTVLESELEADE